MTNASPGVPAPTPAKVVATHSYASRGSADTETKVLVASGARSVTLRVRMLPGLRSWSLPPSAVLRRWADEALTGTSTKRTGRRYESQNDTGWSITWMTTRTSA